jgi:cystathionine gamma-synthase
MGGSVQLLPESPHYEWLKPFFDTREQLLYQDDARILLHNGADYEDRVAAANRNAFDLVHYLKNHPAVENVYYTEGSDAWAAIGKDGGGYGSLLSFTLKDPSLMAEFYDMLDVAKGPSLGFKETLVTPHILLAHYTELEVVQEIAGFPPDLIRVSVGSNKFDETLRAFEFALDRIQEPLPKRSYTIFHPNRVEVFRPAD